MICFCHGKDYPHEWRSSDFPECCGEPEEDCDPLTKAEYEAEESRYLDRQNARYINRRIE